MSSAWSPPVSRNGALATVHALLADGHSRLKVDGRRFCRNRRQLRSTLEPLHGTSWTRLFCARQPIHLGVMTGVEGVIPVVWRCENRFKVVFKSSYCSPIVETPPNCYLQSVWHKLVWCISPVLSLFILPTAIHCKDKVTHRPFHLHQLLFS